MRTRPAAAALLATVGLEPMEPVLWGTPPGSTRSGVYVVETDEPLEEAPIDLDLVEAWLARVPGLRVDGNRPGAEQLAERLARFWIPSHRVTYIGLTTGSLRSRVRAYYRTPLGDPRPHAGGHWIQTLAHIERFRVWWAETATPGDREDALLKAFAASVPVKVRQTIPGGSDTVLPFANRQNASGKFRKPAQDHRRCPEAAVDLNRRTGGQHRRRGGHRHWRRPSCGQCFEQRDQRRTCPCRVRAPRRASLSSGSSTRARRLGLLRDSATRPGLPLRTRLRAGDIDNAYQEGGRFWFIACPRD